MTAEDCTNVLLTTHQLLLTEKVLTHFITSSPKRGLIY